MASPIRSNALFPLLLLPLLAACGGSGAGPVKSTRAAPPPRPALVAPQPVRPPMRYRPRNPQMQAAPGLDGVLGATADELTGRFGTARLDVWEGDARKLQFTGAACVLDVFLYPEAPGREPEASWIDARRSSDGQDVDRGACIAALQQR